MKEFSSSARLRQEDGREKLVDLPFTLDGSDYVLRAPKDAQLAYLYASSATSRDGNDRIAAILDFFEAALAPPGNELLRTRLLDPADELELEDVMSIIEWAIEEWTGRPPTSPNGSSQQPSAVGRRSKATASARAARR